MSDTTVVETVEVETVNAKSTLRRFASAFKAKVRKAAAAVKAAFVRAVGDNEHTVAEQGKVRTVFRWIAAVPKWITLTALAVVRLATTLVVLVATGIAVLIAGVAGVAALVVSAVAGALAFLVSIVALAVFKVFQGIALVIRTPYLALVSRDALACDWEGYVLGWAPRYYLTTSIAQAHAQRAARQRLIEAEAALAEELERDHMATVIPVGQAPKGHPTPRQRKSRQRQQRTQLLEAAATGV